MHWSLKQSRPISQSHKGAVMWQIFQHNHLTRRLWATGGQYFWTGGPGPLNLPRSWS